MAAAFFMATTTNNTRYTGTAIALHWILALALIGIFAFGLYMTSLPFSPTKLKYFNWHKWAGMTILILSACASCGALPTAPRLCPRPPRVPCPPGNMWPTTAYTT